MKRDELNDWLSLAANLGVILSLVFLGVQINQSNKVTAAATYQNRISEIELSYQNSAQSDYLPGIYEKYTEQGVAALSAIELRRVRDWEHARVYRMQGQYYQYQQGFLDDSSYQDLVEGVRNFLPIWRDLGVDYLSLNTEFVSMIENGR